MIEFCYNLNPDIQYEIGTEEAIRRFEPEELEMLVNDLHVKLDEKVFNQIKYLVIQSGTSLQENTNTGEYNKDRLLSMVEVAKSWGLLSKEHNGDYIPSDLIKEKMSLGLDSINIAPEFGLIETQTYIKKMEKNWDFGSIRALINKLKLILKINYMNCISRDKDVVLGKNDLEDLYTIKDFPVFMGCVDSEANQDIKSDMSWKISTSSGAIQLNPVLPLDVVYAMSHGSGTVGDTWKQHHKAFSEFVIKFEKTYIK